MGFIEESFYSYSYFGEDSGDELLFVLLRYIKVVVIGNNCIKLVLVGFYGVVMKVVGLGGWYWFVIILKSF